MDKELENFDIIPEEQRPEEHPEDFLVVDDGKGNSVPLNSVTNKQ